MGAVGLLPTLGAPVDLEGPAVLAHRGTEAVEEEAAHMLT